MRLKPSLHFCMRWINRKEQHEVHPPVKTARASCSIKGPTGLTCSSSGHATPHPHSSFPSEKRKAAKWVSGRRLQAVSTKLAGVKLSSIAHQAAASEIGCHQIRSDAIAVSLMGLVQAGLKRSRGSPSFVHRTTSRHAHPFYLLALPCSRASTLTLWCGGQRCRVS